jgi:hypothetical protein
LKFFVLLATALLVAAAPARAFEEDEPWQEAAVDLPPAPQESDLIQFGEGSVSPNRFYIDGKNILPGPDGVLRYTLVVVAPSGARNVSFEGIRCKTGERRLYATARKDGTWAESSLSRWQVVSATAYNRHHLVLMRECFCDMVVMNRDVAMIRDRLRNTLQY